MAYTGNTAGGGGGDVGGVGGGGVGTIGAGREKCYSQMRPASAITVVVAV